MEKKKIILKISIFLIILIVLFLPGYSKYQELAQRNRLLEGKISNLEVTNQDLKEELKKLEVDPTYMEKVARDKLRVSKKGEIIYKIVEVEDDETKTKQ